MTTPGQQSISKVFRGRQQPFARQQQARILVDEYAQLVRSAGTGWLTALAAFQGLKGDSRLALNDFHYSIMIQACGKGGQWGKAIEIFGQMRDKRLKPNNHTFTHLINACSHADDDALAAEKAYAAMLAHHVSPNSYTSTAMVAALAKAGNWEKSLEVLLHSETLPPANRGNSYTYNATIDACRKAERWELTVALLQRMRWKREDPVEYTYHAVLGSLADAKQWEPALRVFQWMKKAGLGPTHQAQEALSRACVGAPPHALASIATSPAARAPEA